MKTKIIERTVILFLFLTSVNSFAQGGQFKKLDEKYVAFWQKILPKDDNDIYQVVGKIQKDEKYTRRILTHITEKVCDYATKSKYYKKEYEKVLGEEYTTRDRIAIKKRAIQSINKKIEALSHQEIINIMMTGNAGDDWQKNIHEVYSIYIHEKKQQKKNKEKASEKAQ